MNNELEVLTKKVKELEEIINNKIVSKVDYFDLRIKVCEKRQDDFYGMIVFMGKSFDSFCKNWKKIKKLWRL